MNSPCCTQPRQSSSRKDLKDGPSTQRFYCRTIFRFPVIAISVFGVRRGSLGFNSPQETFFKGISFFPTSPPPPPQLLSDYYSKTNLTTYYQKHHNHWRSRKDFFLSQVSSQLTSAFSFQILLLKEKLEKSGYPTKEQKKSKPTKQRWKNCGSAACMQNMSAVSSSPYSYPRAAEQGAAWYPLKTLLCLSYWTTFQHHDTSSKVAF